MFHDTAVHDIDMVCWLLGEFPHTVFSAAFAHDPEIANAGDVDTMSLTLQFPSGVIATTQLSRHSTYGYDQRIEVWTFSKVFSNTIIFLIELLIPWYLHSKFLIITDLIGLIVFKFTLCVALYIISVSYTFIH